jgi:PAS domain S-box-containing protein
MNNDLPQADEELGSGSSGNDLSVLENLSHQDMIALCLDMQQEISRLGSELKHFVHLYEFAPVAYISLNDLGRIISANLTAAVILGVKRGDLLNMPITHFVHPEDHDVCKLRCEELFIEAKPQVCTLRMLRTGNIMFWAQIEARLNTQAASGRPVCRLILSDVSERINSEQEYRAHSEEINKFFDSSLDLMCIATTDGYFMKLNQEWERALGYQLADMENTRFLDLVHPEDFAATIDKLKMLDQGEEVLSFTNRYRHKDGSYRWIEWRSIPSGKTIYAAARDITERILAEHKLRESEDRFKYIFEAANVGKSITLPDGRLNANKAYADMLGYPIEELNTLSWQDVTPAEDIAAIEELMEPLIQNRCNSLRFTKRYVHKSGSFVWADVSVSTRYNEDGSLRHFISTIVDITQARIVEQKYQTLFKEMLNAMAIHEIILDEDGKPADYRFLEVNPAFTRMTGLRKEEVIGKTVLEVLPDTEDYWIQTYGRVALTGEPTFIAEYSRAFDKYFEVSAYGPAPGQFVCIFTDVTQRIRMEAERNKLQEQVLQAQKMQSIGRLAGGVAHDFNNMLGIIIGHAEIVTEQLRPADPMYSDIMQIRQAAKRSADITRQLLAFASKQNIAPREIDLNSLITNLLKMLRRLIGENIELSFQPYPEPCVVCMDPSQIDQILVNLCVNARDSISAVGSITIATSLLDASECEAQRQWQAIEGDYVLLSVSDTGSGMDSETLDKMFEPFFTTKELGKGTGLGLATIYGIVQQNHGCIKAESKPGVGTRILIYLPRVADPSAREESALPKLIMGDQHILVVEDELAILNMTCRMLEKMGYHVITSADAAQALDLAKDPEIRIDLLITDLMMPKLSGIKLAEQVQILRPGLPCLYMSGYSSAAIAPEADLIKHGVFMQKPFSALELSTKVSEALNLPS